MFCEVRENHRYRSFEVGPYFFSQDTYLQRWAHRLPGWWHRTQGLLDPPMSNLVTLARMGRLQRFLWGRHPKQGQVRKMSFSWALDFHFVLSVLVAMVLLKVPAWIDDANHVDWYSLYWWYPPNANCVLFFLSL